MKKFLGLFSTGDKVDQWREVVGFFKFCFGKLNCTHRGFQEGWRKRMAFILGFSSGVQVVSMF